MKLVKQFSTQVHDATEEEAAVAAKEYVIMLKNRNPQWESLRWRLIKIHLSNPSGGSWHIQVSVWDMKAWGPANYILLFGFVALLILVTLIGLLA